LYLDAPPSVLYERKHEGTLESLQTLREEFLELASRRSDVVVLDATRPLDEIERDARELICDFAVTWRSGGDGGAGPPRRSGERTSTG